MKYRIVKTPAIDALFPYKYTAQRRGIFGIWFSIDWAFGENNAYQYAESFHRKKVKAKEKPEIVKEFEL